MIRSLDQLRVDAGVSKAASTTHRAQPLEHSPAIHRSGRPARVPLIVSIADELGARVEITTREPHGRGVRQRESRQARFQ